MDIDWMAKPATLPKPCDTGYREGLSLFFWLFP